MIQQRNVNEGLVHRRLACGAQFAADVLPSRQTVALSFRVLGGASRDPLEKTGLCGIVERLLSKGTQRYDGRKLADAFDALGAQWGTASGRQTTQLRILCLPEFTVATIDLAAELLRRPTFPQDAFRVAISLAQEERRHLDDDPHDLMRVDLSRATYGPMFGRNAGGEPETLAAITHDDVRSFWAENFRVGALQVSAAGPVNVDALTERIDEAFGGWGDATPMEAEDAQYEFTPARNHRDKETKQQYIGLTLEGLPKPHPQFPVEQVLIGVLSGGMSGRLFTEVREKQGLVYWVGAWHEQPRGRGVIGLGASTTPERCQKTYETLLRELKRISQDLTIEEVVRARDGLIAQAETEDDLTRARASGISDDLFHFNRPIGLGPKLEAIRAVTLEQVREMAAKLPIDRLCVATVGPTALA